MSEKLQFTCYENIKQGCFECTLHNKTHEMRRKFDSREMSRLFWRHDFDQSFAEDVKCYHDRVKAFAEEQMRREWAVDYTALSAVRASTKEAK